MSSELAELLRSLGSNGCRSISTLFSDPLENRGAQRLGLSAVAGEGTKFDVQSQLSRTMIVAELAQNWHALSSRITIPGRAALSLAALMA